MCSTFGWLYRLLSDCWQTGAAHLLARLLPVAIISYYLCNMRFLFMTNSQIRPRSKNQTKLYVQVLLEWIPSGAAGREGVALWPYLWVGCKLLAHASYLNGRDKRGRGKRGVCVCWLSARASFFTFLSKATTATTTKATTILQRGLFKLISAVAINLFLSLCWPLFAAAA